jgi:hypothetical protein
MSANTKIGSHELTELRRDRELLCSLREALRATVATHRREKWLINPSYIAELLDVNEAHDESTPSCDLCGAAIVSGLMAISCERGEKCAFWPDDAQSQAFLRELGTPNESNKKPAEAGLKPTGGNQ